MTNRHEVDRALQDIESTLTNGKATDTMPIAEDIMQVQQILLDRLGNVEQEM